MPTFVDRERSRSLTALVLYSSLSAWFFLTLHILPVTGPYTTLKMFLMYNITLFGNRPCFTPVHHNCLDKPTEDTIVQEQRGMKLILLHAHPFSLKYLWMMTVMTVYETGQ
jgi:hypothetical protein